MRKILFLLIFVASLSSAQETPLERWDRWDATSTIKDIYIEEMDVNYIYSCFRVPQSELHLFEESYIAWVASEDFFLDLKSRYYLENNVGLSRNVQAVMVDGVTVTMAIIPFEDSTGEIVYINLFYGTRYELIYYRVYYGRKIKWGKED